MADDRSNDSMATILGIGRPDAIAVHASLSQISNPHSIYRNLDAPAVSAYITFEYTESTARCLEDYQRYSRYPFRWFFPTQLLFKGRQLKVTKAPEPDQILWENLEITDNERFYRAAISRSITLLLLISCFIIILIASVNKVAFAKVIPKSTTCDSIIPSLYVNGTTIPKGFLLSDISLYRDSSLDNECKQIASKSFYGTFRYNSKHPTGNYNIDACSADNLCPKAHSETYCPCISTTSSEQCASVGCGVKRSVSGCQYFDASTISACYCHTTLLDTLQKRGPIATLRRIDTNGPADVCYDFDRKYSIGVGLTYVSILATTVIGMGLRYVLVYLSKYEAHRDTDEEQASAMIKLFQSGYAISVVIVLIAYGGSPSTPAFLRRIGVFAGPYTDFDRPWYGNIGFLYMVSFILQSFTPLAYNLIEYYFIKPVLRLYHHNRVR